MDREEGRVVFVVLEMDFGRRSWRLLSTTQGVRVSHRRQEPLISRGHVHRRCKKIIPFHPVGFLISQLSQYTSLPLRCPPCCISTAPSCVEYVQSMNCTSGTPPLRRHPYSFARRAPRLRVVAAPRHNGYASPDKHYSCLRAGAYVGRGLFRSHVRCEPEMPAVANRRGLL